MRAIQFKAYGPPDVLSAVTADVPAVGNKQIRVRVEATSINHVDVLARAGGYKRLTRTKAPYGTGIDLVGVVDAVGGEVTSYSPGDRVWGVLGNAFSLPVGMLADYALLPCQAVAPAPTGITSEQAVSALVPATIAWTAMEHVPVAPGDTVVVRGAAGGMGSAMVQLAAHNGARVIGIATDATADFVMGLGADQVLDFHRTGPGDIPRADGIFDTTGVDLLAWRKRLNPNGRMVTTAALRSPSALGAVLASFPTGRRRVRGFVGQPAPRAIAQASQLLTDGIVKPHVAATFAMDQVADAHRLFESGNTIGRLVVTPR
ncbi:NADP-dependent oxidoreductase [Rhodococcus sp. IEGM 1354]|uniref:quinone oxidoreductase family protein n=1 Tax=Rhodococcus sp. IEGM 1354 TaxID=3047088 RepID=UPI0024B75A43|nr:NADP-dependent oxidoreductase [Rhodococcus sp. IEGM 1354]MDI9930752.1 NADP-dependent oxidoreductase [Rhodococcus sp. IEGM 1354]